uniref:Uncharacterized protein n=1 Tax=Rhizophora mucronata TaxID=61149 RepID=A0A2P2LTK5_RHIMU
MHVMNKCYNDYGIIILKIYAFGFAIIKRMPEVHEKERGKPKM